MQKVVVAAGGASGAIYTKVLFDRLLALQDQWEEIGVVFSDNARVNWELELGDFVPERYPFRFFDKTDFTAPFASGSAQYTSMIICPCSMGLLGRIANGLSNDLTTRAADVMLKERRRLVLITRDTPLSLIHIENMRLVTLAGGVILPACPNFYSNPSTFEDLAATVIDRALDICGFSVQSFRWGEPDKA